MNISVLENKIKLGCDFAYGDGVKLVGMMDDQKRSFQSLLNGFTEMFKSFPPIKNHNETASLEFIDCMIEEQKTDSNVCAMYSMTLAANIKVKCRLTVYNQVKNTIEIDGKVEEKTDLVVKDVRDQWIMFTEIPLMNDYGTFLINGCEYVVISQMHRSPGVFFDHDDGKGHSGGKYLYNASLIPSRGSWLDLEFDAYDVIYFRIDKKRKIPLPTLLMACGLSKQDIINTFYRTFSFNIDRNPEFFGETLDEQYVVVHFDKNVFLDSKLVFNICDKNQDLVLPIGTRLDKRNLSKLEKFLDSEGKADFLVKVSEILNSVLSKDILQNNSKVASYGELVNYEILNRCKSAGISSVNVILVDYHLYSPYMVDSIKADKNNSKESSLLEICRIFRGSDSSIDIAVASEMFQNIFFVENKYDLSAVGRAKLNNRVHLNNNEQSSALTVNDIIAIIKELIKVKDGFSEIDDIDHLNNRRVRFVGELVENQIKISMMKLIKNAIDKISSAELDGLMPYDLIYPKFISATIKEFFTLSQFSQFMDQTNPLSEITHKRRISALGVGGLNRDRVGFEVRDVHYTHYGRICPIETPEGANIGLISSLAVYAKIDDYGFIRTPYRKVIDGVVTSEVIYLSAFEEKDKNIAEISSPVDLENKLTDKKVTCRRYGEFVSVSPEEVDYIDVSSKQTISVAASLIPFLDNDDAGRALMGANMQRQAVPLLKPTPPIIGTGMEEQVAHNSGVVLFAERDGVVTFVDSDLINILYDGDSCVSERLGVFHLKKFRKSNYNTCINQVPTVFLNQKVKKGDVIAEGFGTKDGHLALGDNILIAFLSWNGYNFEDSIIVSEKLIRDDVFTSIHLEEFECAVRDTKVGEERITRDIPNASEDLLSKLDENGLIPIGTEVKPGDILVGKVMPKGDVASIPEEKLLRAVFGENVIDVVDASLYVPPGISGVVSDIKILSRAGLEKDYITTMNDRKVIDGILREMFVARKTIASSYVKDLMHHFSGERIKSISKKHDHLIGSVLSFDFLEKLELEDLLSIDLDIKDKKLSKMKEDLAASFAKIDAKYKNAINDVTEGFGASLPHSVLKVVKVMIATKSKLQPGDKMSGRHGNKGVVSLIVPTEDMPYMEDGTPIDIILSPLGIPSRMNIGQVLEVHLGMAVFSINRQIQNLIRQKKPDWQEKVKNLLSSVYNRQENVLEQIKHMSDEDMINLAKELDKKMLSTSVPVFSGPKDDQISHLLKVAGLDESGQCDLYDGMTGEKIHRKVTVGIMYLLKLHHLVDNKIHARSIGPYSLVTQQPLGGRSHFGGQRFGEMECWALQAYGAAYTLQEMLTVKSDDVVGRVAAYDAIVKGNNSFSYYIPESFNVILKELMALGLNMEFIENKEPEKTDNNTESR
jgi:DNA-directed RNA polymerase subunit beta